MLQEIAFITGKCVTADAMKNDVPIDRNLHEEFEYNENIFADTSAEKSKLYDKIALLDENFDEKKTYNKETQEYLCKFLR